MALITIPQLDRTRPETPLEKWASQFDDVIGHAFRRVTAQRQLLKEAMAPLDWQFDIFLSHSYRDAVRVRALKGLIEELGYSVYVDWVEDDELNRQGVDAATAARLRQRIHMSRCLLVHVTPNTSVSRWVPWELGFADGAGKQVGILPTPERDVKTDRYEGEEYLKLYPYIDLAEDTEAGEPTLWANSAPDIYVSFDRWLNGQAPHARQSRGRFLRG